MPVRNTLLSLFPKHYYRTSVQRQIRCCGVLMTKSEKKEGNWFQSTRDEMERWRKEEKEGKTMRQFMEEFRARQAKKENKVPSLSEKIPPSSKPVTRLTNIVTPLLEGIQKRYPRSYELFFRVRNGLWNLMNDFKLLVILNYKIMKDNSALKSFNLHELDIVYEGFIQIKRMFPVFILAILPFGNLFVLLAAYLRPLKLLTPHFWSDEQKETYVKQQHAARVSVFQPIIQRLEMQLSEKKNFPLHAKFHEILISVEDGRTPNLSELLVCKSLFSESDCFSLKKLPAEHLKDLMVLHGHKNVLLKNDWLEEWVSYMHLVDARIKHDGGVSKLSVDNLKKFCFQRGVNANAMNEEEMREYLDKWIKFSEQISYDFSSLLLHAPALFGYNHKSNHSVTDSSNL